jgi:redox-sensitive bicupin YhaK (pirin superfamily)
MIISARERDLGGFSVRRILPYATKRMVGPFIFFDHIGPATFPPGQGLSVRPHPHIHLATVTYLFEGKIQHRDSLGSDQLIEPGAINWMTAGRGIVHSERSPHELYVSGSRLSGLQCWVALPNEHENMAPSFTHHPASTLPSFKQNDVECTLLLGTLFEQSSPVPVHSDLFYCKAEFPAGSTLTIPLMQREAAVYVVSGLLQINDHVVNDCSMWVHEEGEIFTIKALEPSVVMLLGGLSVGQRHIYWNFVSSSQDAIEQAKQDWSRGPGTNRFPQIPGDDKDYIPLPNADEPAKQPPPGNIM